MPRLVQGLFAAVGDLYVFRLSLRLCGARTARWTLLFQLTSWFTFYCAPRTLTNSMEAVLTAVALYYYPWPGRTTNCRLIHLTLVHCWNFGKEQMKLAVYIYTLQYEEHEIISSIYFKWLIGFWLRNQLCSSNFFVMWTLFPHIFRT